AGKGKADRQRCCTGGDRKQQEKGLARSVTKVFDREAPDEEQPPDHSGPPIPTRSARVPRLPPTRRVSSTKAPSRIEISRSAVAAIRSSCVTMTSVYPVVWRTSNSR